MDEHGEEGYCDDCITYSVAAHTWALGQGHDAEGELERKYFTRFGDQRGGKEWGEYTFTWFNNMGDWKPIEEFKLKDDLLEFLKGENTYIGFYNYY